VRFDAVDVIVIDSVAALVPRAELDGDMATRFPGYRRASCRGPRKLTRHRALGGR